MNVYSFNYSTVIFFPNPKTSELFKKMSPTNLFYIGLRTLKPTRMRTLSRIPIGQGVIRVGLYSAAISRTVWRIQLARTNCHLKGICPIF